MADDSDTGSPVDAGRPRRPPPTIDLTAADVTERPSAAEAATPAEPIDTAPSDMPPPEMPEPVLETPAAEEPTVAEPAASPRARVPVVVPALTGAAAAAILVGVAWLAGFGNTTSVPSADPAALDALASRVTRIEARPAASPDAGLATRVDALEKSVTALRGEFAATKSQVDRINAARNDAQAALSPQAPAVDLSPINQRLSQIERAASELKAVTAQQSAKSADDGVLRRVVAASLLDMSVRQGEPYAAILAAAKPLAPDPNLLKSLDNFAATGIPNAAALSRDLLALLPKTTAENPNIGNSLVDRLQAGAVKLLHIERTDATPGDNRSGAISRATAALRSNDIATAKRELLTLPATERASVQPWLDKIDARDAALAASRQFAADAMAALSKPAP